MKFDVVITGSGLGGLQCAYILSREGYNVCLIEKNPKLGGCLQTFKRNNIIFDTGMHYIGGMDEGQVLHNFFRFFNLTGKLKLKKLDEDAYDIVRFEDKEYKFAMGYDRFLETMASYFPKEGEAIRQYIGKLHEISNSVDLYNMRDFSQQKARHLDYYGIGFNNYLDSITQNETLKNVLLATSPLYAGVKNRTPLYIPMIIHSSFIQSAYRFIDGGSQISDLLAGSILDNGGTIMRNTEATRFHCNTHSMTAVEVNFSEIIEGKYFISDIHPKTMLHLMGKAPIRPAYRKRITSTEDTCGVFTLYLSMKKNSFEYINSNYYVYHSRNLWYDPNYVPDDATKGYMIHISPGSQGDKYADAVIINTYMDWNEVKAWEHTHTGQRGENYSAFKQQKADKLLDRVEMDFPGIRAKIDSCYTSTPLTYRDYTGTYKGSVYGILKDYNNPMKTLLLPRTNLPNLFLTGQNINVHGVVGVTIGSILTCSELLGIQPLMAKLHNA
jgi:all-trans-retinol 13,14-reductase